MHQCLIQWHGDDVEVVRADESISIATTDPVFWELGDLIETNMMLKDFGGNASNTSGAINIELTIGSKTLLTTFFVIDGKSSCKLLCTIDYASMLDSVAWR